MIFELGLELRVAFFYFSKFALAQVSRELVESEAQEEAREKSEQQFGAWPVCKLLIPRSASFTKTSRELIWCANLAPKQSSAARGASVRLPLRPLPARLSWRRPKQVRALDGSIRPGSQVSSGGGHLARAAACLLACWQHN